MSSKEQEIFSKLDGPRALDEVIVTQRDAFVLQRLVSRKQLALAALTPSDAAHVLELYEQWDKEAALQGLELFAHKRNVQGQVAHMNARELAAEIIETLCQRSASVLLDAALTHDGFADVSSLHPLVRAGFARHRKLLRVEAALNVPIVALGASARTYYPSIGQKLGTAALIPEHADVANAIGAVVGLVRAEVVIVVSTLIELSFRVHHPESPRDFLVLEEALTFAEMEAIRLARAEAERLGASHIEVKLTKDIKCPMIEDKPYFVEARFSAEAFGRPGYEQAESQNLSLS
jgi:N-methylhydantoinase A/oxoprolinase/acetone carboxylase beta subunit